MAKRKKPSELLPEETRYELGNYATEHACGTWRTLCEIYDAPKCPGCKLNQKLTGRFAHLTPP